MPYIHFSDEEKSRANSVDLADFLLRRGEKLLPAGCEKRLERDHSITIRGSEWYDHAAERGGGAASFVQMLYGLTYPEAVQLLLSSGTETACHLAENPAPPSKTFQLPARSAAQRRLYAYLCQQRGISREILTEFVRLGLVYESCEASFSSGVEYHNAVFVGTDEQSIARHAHKRSLYSQGKGYRLNVSGSNPNYSFHYLGSGGGLYVYEAPIDMLSYITLYPDNWQQRSYVALCGVSKHALIGVLEMHPQITTVHLCLDNDPAGIKASVRLKEELSNRNIQVHTDFPKHKDWNDELLCLKTESSPELR